MSMRFYLRVVALAIVAGTFIILYDHQFRHSSQIQPFVSTSQTDTVPPNAITSIERHISGLGAHEDQCTIFGYYVSREGHVWIDPDILFTPIECRYILQLGGALLTKHPDGYHVVLYGPISTGRNDEFYQRGGFDRAVKVEVQK